MFLKHSDFQLEDKKPHEIVKHK